MAESGEEDSGEKEFEASEQKQRQAREEGNIAQSKEMTGFAVAIGILVITFVFKFVAGGALARNLFGFFHHADAYSTDVFKQGGEMTLGALTGVVLTIMSPLLILVAIVLGVIIATQAFAFSAKKIKPEMKKLNPVENFKKKYGPQGMIDFLRDAAKMIVAGVIAGIFLLNFAQDYYGASALQTDQIGNFAFEQVLKLIIAFAVFQFILAAIDFPIQKRLHANRLKMTREEMKKELKQSEGDPLLKQQRREKGAKISRGQMMQNVETSTVIMVNPEHYAVALKWDPETQKAPVVVAKGVDHLAAKIREIAIAHQVPIYRDPPSTRAIYATVEIDEEIHPEHFAAVAAAIQYVDRIRGAMTGREG